MISVRTLGITGVVGLLLGFSGATQAQQSANNDGFQRRNGQMQVLRNGQARPMTRDIHLPTGATVTKDGFVVAADGQRTELREGQGCDLRGRPVALVTAANGTVALAAPAAVSTRAMERQQAPPARGLLEELFGSRRDEGRYYKKEKKNHGKGKGRWKGEDDD